jgi:rRNA maturation endonuclease Nob1
MAATKYGPNESTFAKFDDLATRNDVDALLAQIDELRLTLKTSVAKGTTTAPDLANVASTMVNSIAAQPVFQGFAPGTWPAGAWQTRCGGCGTVLPGGAKFCPGCGARVAST